MTGAKGLKGSRNLILMLTRSFISSLLGSARMLLFPRALGPHSNLPWKRPMTLPATRSSTILVWSLFSSE